MMDLWTAASHNHRTMISPYSVQELCEVRSCLSERHKNESIGIITEIIKRNFLLRFAKSSPSSAKPKIIRKITETANRIAALYDIWRAESHSHRSQWFTLDVKELGKVRSCSAEQPKKLALIVLFWISRTQLNTSLHEATPDFAKLKGPKNK